MALAPVPMMPTTLSASSSWWVVGTTARVPVVPTRGMERRALERLHPRDRRDLHQVEDPDGHDHVPGVDLVAAIGVDHPARAGSRPTRSSRTPVWNNAASTRSNRRAIASTYSRISSPKRVALRRDVLHLLEHRHVAVRLDVAHDPGIAVPVPRPADAARPGRSVRMASIPRLRSCAPATTPGMPAPMIATSTSSVTGSRSVIGVKGSARYFANGLVASEVADRCPRRSPCACHARLRYLARTASGSKSDASSLAATIRLLLVLQRGGGEPCVGAGDVDARRSMVDHHR